MPVVLVFIIYSLIYFIFNGNRDYKYFNENKAEKELNIIVTSTLGLCGGYNIAIEKYVLNNISKNNDLIVLGAKGITYFTNNGYTLLKKYSELPSLDLKEELSNTLTRIALKEFDSGKGSLSSSYRR